MKTTAYERLIDALRDRGGSVRDGHGRAQAQCPAHDDGRASLSLSRIDGSVLVYCHAGCATGDVLAAVGLAPRDLFDNPRGAQYNYPDGRTVHRSPDKQFRQSGNTQGDALYCADRINGAQHIFITEGEKDCHAVESAGGAAVCPAMGAGKSHKFDWIPLRGKHVTVIADRDDSGRRHARDIAAQLDGIAAKTRVVEPVAGKDAADHIAAGHGLDDFTETDLPPPPQAGADDALPVDPDGSRFIHPRDGLLARDLARQVTRSVTCGYNTLEERFYIYDRGVWRHNHGGIEAIIAYWLGNRYRQSHARNVMDLIRFDPDTARIDCEPTPEWINTGNGMIRWSDGTLHAHSPEYRSTVQLPVEYRRDADCPAFIEFVESVLPEDCWIPTCDSPGFIWELIGYMLYAGNPLHIAVLLYGDGRNGKGSLIRVLKHLIGDANYSTATLHELVENRFRAATLYGKLANLAGDLDSKWLASTAMFKSITGGDSVQGEHKYGAAFDFAPWAVPMLSTNLAFGSADSSEGWMARWVVVPFPNSFLGREDRQLDARLGTDSELRGILRRAVDALWQGPFSVVQVL